MYIALYANGQLDPAYATRLEDAGQAQSSQAVGTARGTAQLPVRHPRRCSIPRPPPLSPLGPPSAPPGCAPPGGAGARSAPLRLLRSASRRPRCRWRAASAGGSSGAGPERRQTPVGRCGAACTRVSLWCGWDTVLRQVGAGGETQLFVKANRKCWWIRC